MIDNRLVTAEALKAVLNKLRAWMPFEKINGGMHIPHNLDASENTIFSVGDSGNDNLFKVCSNGKVYILDIEDHNTPKSLQDFLNKRDNFVVKNQQDWDNQEAQILTKNNFGAVVQIEEDIQVSGTLHVAGLYLVSLVGQDFVLSKLGIVSSSSELPEERLAALEKKVIVIDNQILDINNFIQNGAMTNEDVDNSTK